VAAYVTLNLEPVSRRLDVLPYYARTYVNKLRPKPALPTPPAVSEIDAETLLQTRAEAIPQAEAAEALSPGPAETINDGSQTSGASGVRLAESNVTDVQPPASDVTLAGFEHEWQTTVRPTPKSRRPSFSSPIKMTKT
jgi:hypothetical protein